MKPTALYRHFNKNGDLLYVGVSVSPMKRTRQHARFNASFKEVSRIELEWFDSRTDAELAEKQAISSERPIFNITHSITRHRTTKRWSLTGQPDCEVTLKDFLIHGTQTELATFLQIQQSAVSQMLAAGRDIRVCLNETGEIVHAYEIKVLMEVSTSKAA